MNKKLIAIPLIMLGILGGVFGFNYFTLTKPLDSVLKSDYRNNGIEVSAHYENYVNPNVLVFDIKNIDLKKTRQKRRSKEVQDHEDDIPT